ncbi:MAG: carboxypeptidase regulatory-like domain-containing protein [bacterium]
MNFLRLVVLSVCAAALCLAQINRATLTGIVTDPSEAVVPGVRVVATHVETGVSSSTTTTSAGAYTLPALQIGTYRVEYEGQGFKRSVQNGVVLTAGATVRLDITLELGAVGESVTVSAQAAPLETESTRVATNVTTKLVQDLPMLVDGGIRSIFTLASIAPETKGTGQDFRIGGGQAVGWEMLMDGMPMSSASALYQGDRASLGSVPIDAISEFTVESSGTKAEYGRSMGAVTFETKSGTNSLHGNAFENLRNNILDANGFFNNAEGRPRPVLKQHDFGATLGGPVYIPKIYDGRNKTFFFGSYQGFRNRAGITNPQFLTIPTAGAWEGNFSTWTRNGKYVQIYDPASTQPNPSGSGYIRTPFADNQIPLTRFSEVAKRIIAVRPADFLPNVDPRSRGLLDADVGNYVRYEGSRVNPWNKASARIDHHLNNANRFSFLFLEGHQADDFGPDGPPGLPAPFNGSAVVTRFNRSLRFSWYYTTGTLVHSFRVSYQREKGVGVMMSAADPEGTWNGKFQIPNTPGPDRAFPQLIFGTYSSWGGAYWGGDAGKNWNFADDITLIRGSHTIKFGAFYARDLWDGYGQHRPNGSFTFSSLATGIPNDTSGATGNGFASFLLGYVTTAGLETPRLVRQIYNYYGGFVQDDWKVTRNLTLNLGLRWEYTSPIQGGAFTGLKSWEEEATGKVDGFSNFDPTVPNPAAGGLPGAVIFSGKGPGRTSGSLFDGYPWAFGPRVGLAYRAPGNLVIRAYAGRTFGAVKTTGGSTHFEGFILNRNYSSSDNSVLDFPTMLDQGLPPWPMPPFIDPTINNDMDVHFWQRSDAGRPSEYWTWNFDIQRELGQSTVLSVGYTGTKGTYLSSSLNRLNQIEYKYLEQYGRDLLNSNINSPAARAAGIPIPYPGFNSTVARALSPFPQYQNIYTNGGQPASVGERAGNSTYHAMILKVDKRYSNGMSLLGSYVLSKQFSNAGSAAIATGGPLDHYNKRLEKSLADNDQTHVFRIAYTYDLPFGRNKYFDMGRVANAVVGGWTLSGMMNYASGMPQTVTHSYSPIGTGSRVFITSYEGWRAPTKGEKFDPYVDVWLDASKFNQGIPASVLNTQFGNATRNNPKLRSPWVLDESLGLAKNISIQERVGFTIRMEAFNLLNRVRWGNPNNNVTGANFGQIRSQANTPRRMQLALRVTF